MSVYLFVCIYIYKHTICTVCRILIHSRIININKCRFWWYIYISVYRLVWIVKILSSTSTVLSLIISAYQFELLWIFILSFFSVCLGSLPVYCFTSCPSIIFSRSLSITLNILGLFFFCFIFCSSTPLYRLRNFSQEEIVAPFCLNECESIFFSIFFFLLYFWF